MFLIKGFSKWVGHMHEELSLNLGFLFRYLNGWTIITRGLRVSRFFHCHQFLTRVLILFFLFMIFMTSHNVGNFQLLQTLRGRLLWFLLHCKILCAMGKRKPSNTTARKLMYLFYKPWTLVFFPEVKLGP